MGILIIFVLILLNGIFSMSEIAMVSSKKLRLKHQAEQGDKKARRALKLIHNPDRFFSTVQIGITLIGILVGTISGGKITDEAAAFLEGFPALAPYSYTIAAILIVMIITYFTLVLGELLPKRIGMAAPEKTIKLMVTPMRIMSSLAFPFIWALSKSSSFLVRLLGIKKADNAITEEEIKAMISEGATSGTIEVGEQDIIERVFHLDDRNITSMMTHSSDVTWIDLNDTITEYKKTIKDKLHSVYPVCDGNIDDIIGVIYTRDLYIQNERDLQLKELIRTPLFIPENNTVFQVMEKFKIHRTSVGLIVDEYGDFLGMITMKDLLEAIVGDMPEEGETDFEIVAQADDFFLVDAQIPFYDFLSYFEKEDWINDDEQKEFDTLAGFILYHLSHIPIEGEKLDWRGFSFEISNMDGHRIDKILVHILPPPDQEEAGEGDQENAAEED